MVHRAEGKIVAITPFHNCNITRWHNSAEGNTELIAAKTKETTMKTIITITDAAKMLGVSHTAIQYAVKKGRLHAVLGGIDGRRIKGLLADEVYALMTLKDKNIATAKVGGKRI